MFRVSVNVSGDTVVIAQLDATEARARDLTPVWPLVVRVFQGAVVRAFASEGATTGAPWPQLKPATRADRRRLGFPPAHPILQRTGRLLRALTIGEGAYVATTATSMRYVVSDQEVPYFKFHQSRRPRGKLPRRAPVLLTADDRDALMLPIRLYLRGKSTPQPSVG